MASNVPVALMEGVTEGAADLHYGNNINLIGGHVYKVTVTLNGQRAVLQATAARSSSPSRSCRLFTPARRQRPHPHRPRDLIKA